MKVRSTIHVTLLLAALFLACGCSEMNRDAGNAINFDIWTGPDPGTRTSYLNPNTGQEDIDRNLNRISLHWKSGDIVRIAGTAAVLENSLDKFADYLVHSVTTNGSRSRAAVSALNNKKLFWDENASGTQSIYAMYPSPGSDTLSKLLDAQQLSMISLSPEGILKGFIPTSQAPVLRPGTGTGEGAAYVPAVYDPDMSFAYMGALGSAEVGQTVPMPFRPLFTAFEFQISSGEFESVRLSRFVLRNGADMAGAFTADLSQATPTVSLAGGAMDRYVEINFSSYPGGALTVTRDKPVTFTVLALGCDHSNVTIDFEGDVIGRRSLTLKTVQEGVQTPITFAGSKKYSILGLSFPVQLNLISGEGVTWTGDVNTGESLWWHEDDNINTGQDITWR